MDTKTGVISHLPEGEKPKPGQIRVSKAEADRLRKKPKKDRLKSLLEMREIADNTFQNRRDKNRRRAKLARKARRR
jgi:hypothetical protein